MVAARDATTKHLIMNAQAETTTKNYPAQNIHNANIYQLCCRAVVFKVWLGPRLLTIASPGKVLEMQNIGTMGLQTLDVELCIQCFNEHFNEGDHKSHFLDLNGMQSEHRGEITCPKSPSVSIKQKSEFEPRWPNSRTYTLITLYQPPT